MQPAHLLWHRQPPRELRSPILVTAWDGWFDVCNAATTAIDTMRGSDATHLASVDGEDFFDFRERRPLLYLGENGQNHIEWPANEIHCRTLEQQSRDLIFFNGTEPHLRWQTFIDTAMEIIAQFDVKLIITLGSTLAEVPHTRPVKVTGSTPNTELAAMLRLTAPSYRGPTGVTGVFHDRLEAARIPAVSLRASVPHYLAAGPNPMASQALLERFERITGLPTNWAEFERPSQDWISEVDAAVTKDAEIVEYLHRLEERYDKETAANLPTPEDLGAEFERYLRQHDERQT